MSSTQEEKDAAPESVPAEESVALSGKLDGSIDKQALESISPHPPGDQVDRSVMVADMVKQVSMWALRLLIIGVFLYAVGQMAGSFWEGILPVVLALIICTVLAPLAAWMRRQGLPASLAAVICILGFFGAVGGLLAFIAPDFVRQSQTLYLQTVEGIQRLQLWVQGPPLNLDSEELSVYVDEVARWIQGRAGDIAGSVFSGIGTATSIAVTLLVVLVLTFFFLKDGHKFLGWLRGATGRRSGWHLTEVLTRAWNTLGGFVRAQALVSFIDAVLIGIGLAIVGVPLAMALAIITFIAGFIPFVGAIVAGALSVVIALVSLGVTKAIIVLAIVLIVQQLEGNVLSPILQSRAMNLHPVIVLISVTVGSTLFGLVGAFLAVPAVATFAVAWRYVQEVLMVQSGETDAKELEYSTVAGYLIGQYTAEEGQAKRAAYRAQLAADAEAFDQACTDDNVPGGRDAQDLDMDATPGAGRPAGSPAGVRATVTRSRDAIDSMFDSFRRGKR